MGPDRKLELTIRIGNDTPMLHASLYYPKHETHHSRRDQFQSARGGLYRTTDRPTIPVPLAGLPAGTYRVEVQPCDIKGAGGVGKKIEVDL